MKHLRRFIVTLIFLAIVIWLALGPGMRMFLDARADLIISDVKRRSERHILIGSLSGDFWSGIIVENLVIYADHDPAHLPLLTADRVILRLSLMSLLQRDFTPTRVHIRGFNAALHVGADGSPALPDWSFRSADLDEPILHASLGSWINAQPVIRITCEDGILEIHKRFPRLSESVDIVFTQLAGQGEYVLDEGFRIDYITGDYLATPVTLRGFVPTDTHEQMDLTASLGQVQLATVFRDIDPLFRGSDHLPQGKAAGRVQLTGTRERPAVNGSLELMEALLGNVSVNSAEASVAYSAGVIDLTQVTAQAYGGTLEATGYINLLSSAPLWRAVCTFENIDLGSYLDSNNYYSYETAGRFSGSVEAEGDFDNPDALVCTAEITSSGGRYLSPFSERFMTTIRGATLESPVSEADLANYDDVEVRVRIRDSEIQVDRFHFVSADLQVEASGKIGFDHSLEASGGLTVPLEEARRHPQFGRFVSMLPDTLGRASLEFSLSGWLHDVDYSLRPGENLLRGLFDQSSDLLHDLADSFTGFENR